MSTKCFTWRREALSNRRLASLKSGERWSRVVNDGTKIQLIGATSRSERPLSRSFRRKHCHSGRSRKNSFSKPVAKELFFADNIARVCAGAITGTSDADADGT